MKNEKRNIIKDNWKFFVTLFVVTVCLVFVRDKVLLFADVPSGSMLNTIQIHDKILCNRVAYDFEEPERGDIIVFHAPDDYETLYIKRLIGLPGDTITIKDCQLYINGEKYEESYLAEKWDCDEDEEFTFEVPDDSYFFMGDNRNNSWDARYWENHYVSRDNIVAKAMFVYYPFDSIRKLQ